MIEGEEADGPMVCGLCFGLPGLGGGLRKALSRLGIDDLEV